MSTIDAKNKTTTELAIWLEGLSTGDTVYYTEYPNFDEAAKRLRTQEARIAELEAQTDAEPLSTNFIQTVPDKCDRIVWRGDYYHLPPKQAKAITAEDVPDEMVKNLSNYFDYLTVAEAKELLANAVNAFNGVKP